MSGLAGSLSSFIHVASRGSTLHKLNIIMCQTSGHKNGCESISEDSTWSISPISRQWNENQAEAERTRLALCSGRVGRGLPAVELGASW